MNPQMQVLAGCWACAHFLEDQWVPGCAGAEHRCVPAGWEANDPTAGAQGGGGATRTQACSVLVKRQTRVLELKTTSLRAACREHILSVTLNSPSRKKEQPM